MYAYSIHTVYMYQHVTADHLGACFKFLYQPVKGNCSGFSLVFLQTLNGLR